MKTRPPVALRRACLLLGLSTLAVGAAQAQTALDEIVKSKKITIAIPTDFPPYGFVGTDLKQLDFSNVQGEPGDDGGGPQRRRRGDVGAA